MKLNSILTKFSFLKTKTEFENRNNVNFVAIYDEIAEFDSAGDKIETTKSKCGCWFYTTMNLPCRHIFKLLDHKQSNVFDENLNLIPQRWTKNFYMSSHSPFFALNKENEIPAIHVQKIKTASEIDKYKEAAKVLKNTTNLMSTLPQDQFDFYLKMLKDINKSISQHQQPAQIQNVGQPANQQRENHNIDQPAKQQDGKNQNIDQSASANQQSENENIDQPANQAHIQEIDADSSINVLSKCSLVKLPPKNIRIGRPKGAGRTCFNYVKKHCSFVGC